MCSIANRLVTPLVEVLLAWSTSMRSTGGRPSGPGRTLCHPVIAYVLTRSLWESPKKGSWIGAFALKVKIDQPLV